jgi:hypothetical protein
MSEESEEVMRQTAQEAELWELRRSPDLVDELRVASVHRPFTEDGLVLVYPELLLSAANEIEKLRRQTSRPKTVPVRRKPPMIWNGHPDGPLPYA